MEVACVFLEAGKLVDGVRCLQGVVCDADKALARCGDRRARSAQRVLAIREMAAAKVREKLQSGN